MNTLFKQFLNEEIGRLGTPSWRVLESPQGARVCINGKWKISLCSNNYLGLANHPSVKNAAAHAIEKYGAGSVAARSLSGSTPLHEDLERELASFKGTEAAMVFNSGFVTNSGVIPALVGKGDAVLSDEINHGSIIDGCRLSGAEKYIYPHGEMSLLEKLLKDAMHFHKRMIVADAVFSMDGDIAPLPLIVKLAETYDAIVMVDEAHATGVLGRHGRGAVEHFGLEDRVDVIMGTLGKAIGSVGGYIAGSRDLITYLKRTTRSFLLTTSLPASCIAAALAGLRILRDDPKLRERLWENTNLFRSKLTQLGFNTMDSKTPIIPILIGDDEVAQRFCERLYEEGLYVSKIGMPYVPAGTSRLRTIISSAHSEEDLNEALAILKSVGKELEVI
jgi:glycine C-acetyltransferase